MLKKVLVQSPEQNLRSDMALLGLQPSDRAEFATPRVEVCRHTPIVGRTEGPIRQRNFGTRTCTEVDACMGMHLME